ncbi:nucleotidyltransferase [Oligoflexia bacterium]|nr:nucleotidyltransferase [Oligoflexia bacterium]
MSSFLPILEKFECEGISYIIVGGLAVVLHGKARLTTDVDFIVALDQENCLKVIKVLSDLTYYPRIPVNPKDFADPQIRSAWIKEKGLTVMSFYSNANPLIGVDLFVECPTNYDDMLKRAVYKELGEIKVRVAAINDIIDLKRISGRPKDIDDIKDLELILNEGSD